MANFVTVIDNHDKIISKNNSALAIALRSAGEQIVKVAKPLTPVKTGDLRSKIDRRVRNYELEVTWLMDYALFQELGTKRGVKANKFAETSVTKVSKDFIAIYRRSGGTS